MRGFRYLAVATVLAAAPLPALTQAPGQRAPGRGAEMRQPEHHPFALLLENRAQLGLTDEQVRRLETIRSRLEEQNRPLREQLRTARERLMEQRRAEMQKLAPEQRRERMRQMRQMRQQRGPGRGGMLPPELRPVAERLRANTDRAAEEARDVLSVEQRVRAREMARTRMQQRREEMRRRRPGV